MLKKLISYLLTLMIFASIFLYNGCTKDDPIIPKEEHFKAIGMIFYTSGIKIASILRGVTSDTLEAEVGILSPGIDIKFYDENEQEINPPTGGQTLAWELSAQGIVEVWQHPGEEGGFEFHLRGLSDGNVEIEFFIMHEGHADFRSGKISVRVDHDGGTTGEPVGLKLYDEETGTLLLTLHEDGSVTGSLDVATGDTTDHIEVKFYDHEGNEFQPTAPPHSLGLVIDNESITIITGLDPGEPWAFKIIGLSGGSTTLTVQIKHDEEIEKSFPGIPINVN
jgi:hypothetical protein